MHALVSRYWGRRVPSLCSPAEASVDGSHGLWSVLNKFKVVRTPCCDENHEKEIGGEHKPTSQKAVRR